MFFAVAGRLADHAMATGDLETAIAHCQRIIDKDRCREDVYRRLMLCYSRLGQRHRALRWFEVCRRTLQDELEAEPDPDTQALYRRLLANDPL
jgi:DNA-binding SARP family transcriptional activator